MEVVGQREVERLSDNELIYKLKNPLTQEQVKEKYGHLMNQRPKIFEIDDISDDDELTDEEIDNLLDGQEDDTVDETDDGFYNPYKPTYDEPIPEDFENWSHSAKKAWIDKHTI